VVLRELQDLSYEEIAEIVGVPSDRALALFAPRRAPRADAGGGVMTAARPATLQDELDGRLAPSDSQRLAEHVRGCAGAEEQRALSSLRATFADAEVRGPAGFRDAVRIALRGVRVRRSRAARPARRGRRVVVVAITLSHKHGRRRRLWRPASWRRVRRPAAGAARRAARRDARSTRSDARRRRR